MSSGKISKGNLRIGSVELIKNSLGGKKYLKDPQEREKLLNKGEEFSDESIRNYIFGLHKLGISKRIMKEYGWPNIIGINITADLGGFRGKSLYIEEPIDIDLFLAGEVVSAYDSSGEEYEVFMGSSLVIDWSEEEGNSLFVIRKINERYS
jgi:hypothetical protein